ncbi:SDR family NAD(P)-dependent oxidoreductase [Parvularcula sp. LCG005]|uniref:SDR family NAD(P)-dependent oxidoreductase n=1 Tax=Parvularcula sp. LCG005 TaxID=3078805 RepID=UPI002943456C|nr:SDR family NAD(P)-dependent oxidoreductase [Parvularcula sp. LCG005]WOI52498.1 SDR family NAD(P)-dependent oxidoreductase [Parvularcula sp. LCG005]
MALQSFDAPIHAAIFGMGGIGQAFAHHLAGDPAVEGVHCFSSRELTSKDKITAHHYDPHDESSIAQAVSSIADTPINLAIVTIGTLHGDAFGPEKAMRDLDSDTFLKLMQINALIPALIGKHLLPHFKKRDRAIFAALSARVGSISDNRLGGWHSYRASKAALNQLVRNMAIEIGHRNDNGIAVTLHPGTVDTGLSAPFQKHVPEGKLFTPDYSAGEMLKVIDGLTPDDSGKCFDYAGKPVIP